MTDADRSLNFKKQELITKELKKLEKKHGITIAAVYEDEEGHGFHVTQGEKFSCIFGMVYMLSKWVNGVHTNLSEE